MIFLFFALANLANAIYFSMVAFSRHQWSLWLLVLFCSVFSFVYFAIFLDDFRSPETMRRVLKSSMNKNSG